jgi:hypothetical protein
MNHYAPLLLCLSAGLVSLGCDQFVDKSKYDAAVKEALQAKQELEQTKSSLEACKQKPEHHYELRSEGFRTFRFDPSTGETCIKLSSAADWKKPDTIRQGCEYVDYINANPYSDEGKTVNFAECYFVGAKAACANFQKSVTIDMSTVKPIEPPANPKAAFDPQKPYSTPPK